MRTEHVRSSFQNAVLVLFCAVGSLSGARGEVIDSSASGFTIRSSVSVARPPGEVYATFLQIGTWWDSMHTYSGNAHNLTVEGRAGGCFCETLEGGGSIRHAEVLYVDPGKTIRMSGGLGPLQAMAVAGTLTWSFLESEGGTRVELVYAVGGYDPNGFRGLPRIVDTVMSVQLNRLKRCSERGAPALSPGPR